MSRARILGYTIDHICEAIDFAKLHGWEPSKDVVPAGTYKVVCAAAESRVSSGAGEYLMTRHAIIEGEYAGTLLWQPLSARPNASWVWADVAEDLRSSLLVGQIMYADVTIEMWEHQRRNKVGKLTSIDGVER